MTPDDWAVVGPQIQERRITLLPWSGTIWSRGWRAIESSDSLPPGAEPVFVDAGTALEAAFLLLELMRRRRQEGF